MGSKWAGRLVMAAACLVLMQGQSRADRTTINFDTLAPFTVVANQYDDAQHGFAMFSSVAGYQVETAPYASSYGTSGPNFIGTASTAGGFDYAHDVILGFARAVSGLSFNATGIDSKSGATVAEVEVFQGGVLTQTVAIVSRGDSFTPVFVDLGAYANVTKIDITGVNDPGGIAYDDFSFVAPASSAPEPSSLVLTGLGLAAGLVARRWRARRGVLAARA